MPQKSFYIRIVEIDLHNIVYYDMAIQIIYRWKIYIPAPQKVTRFSIAEKENKQSIKTICDYIFSFLDISFLLLIILPLYPYRMENYVYSVS